MKRNIVVLFLTGLMTIIAECGRTVPAAQPDQNSLETIVAATLQAYTQEAATTPTPQAQEATSTPTQPSGIPITFQNVNFVIPGGLATGAQSEIVPRKDYVEGDNYRSIAPEYIRFILSRTDSFPNTFDFKISIIPIEEYMQMSDIAADRISFLQQKLANNELTGVTVLPPFSAGLVIDTQNAKIDFQSGSGIRAVQQYAQAPVPISNEYLIYSFQGITNDGKYYISVIAPIRVPFLVETAYNPDPSSTTPTPVVPEGGFIFPALTGFNNPEFAQYYQSITDKLNQTPADQFTPSIPTLDALIQSILVQ